MTPPVIPSVSEESLHTQESLFRNPSILRTVRVGRDSSLTLGMTP